MDIEKMETIPTGLEHITFLSKANSVNRKVSEQFLKQERDNLQVLGISLNALYTAATCHRKCYGGKHILELLAARIYNLSCASYSLISIGFYDESLNLVRSIREIANLLALSVYNKPKFMQWTETDKRQRIREFSPVKIRELLKDSNITLMDEDWYSNLCESYTHITPTTSPNNFNKANRNVCGGVVQENGVSECIEQLTNIVVMVALFYCRYFDLNDIFEKLIKEIDKAET